MKIITSWSNKIHKGTGKYAFQYLAAIAANLSIINSGMHYGWPSPSLPQLLNATSTIHVTSDGGSWIASINLIGSVFGSLIAATTAHLFGRKTIIILTAPPFLLSWIMIAFGNKVVFLYLARFIAGMVDGIVYTVVPMYIGEIASPSIRGAIGTAISSSWIAGILFIDIIGSYTTIKTAALISCIIPILAFVLMIFMPESPYYLLAVNKQDKAKRSLQLFRGISDVDTEFDRINDAVKKQSHRGINLRELFTKNRKSVGIMLMLRTVQQLTGTAAIAFYAQHIFKETGGAMSSKVASIVYFSMQLLLTLISSQLVDRIGRRPLLLFSMVGSTIALLIESIYFLLKERSIVDTSSFSVLPIVALILFVILFSSGLQSIPILMLGELFPSNTKAAALSLAGVYYSILVTLMSKFFQITKDNFGMHVPFFSFSICTLLSLVVVYLFTPETKGKTLEEIQDQLRRMSVLQSKDKLTENSKV